MPVLLLGTLLFIGTHCFTMAREPRAAAIGRLGENGYKVAYSLLSLLGLILIGVGPSGRATSRFSSSGSPLSPSRRPTFRGGSRAR